MRGNVRTAAAAKTGSMPDALTVAFRTGGVAGMFSVGLGLLGATFDHHALPEHELGHPDRLRLRRLAAGAVPARRRRHLHQGGRRRRRPRRQGRGRHPRRRSAQPGHHRRQRGRQRRRLRRHGRRPVRELRGHPRRVDHPRRRRLPVDLPGEPGAGRPVRSSRSAAAPSACWRRSSASSPSRRRRATSGHDADQPGLPHRRHPHRDRHADLRARLRRQPDGRRRLSNVGLRMFGAVVDRPRAGPGGQPPHRVLHVHRDHARCRRSPRPPRPARPPSVLAGHRRGPRELGVRHHRHRHRHRRRHRPRRRQPAVLALPRRPHRHGHAGHHRRDRVARTRSARSPTTPPASPRCPASSTASPSGSWSASTPSATPPRPSPRASPSARPSSPPSRCSPASSRRSATSSACSIEAATTLFSNPLTSINVADPKMFIGLLIGGSVPFLFSALAIRAVGRTAGVVVQEVRTPVRRRQDHDAARSSPTTARSSTSAPTASLRELATPALLAVLTPGDHRLRHQLLRPRRVPRRGHPHRPADGQLPVATPAGRGTTPRSTSRTATTAARAPTPTRRPSSATPSATRSRTPPARR